MPVPNVMGIHPIVVETFHSKLTNVSMMVAPGEKSEDHQSKFILSVKVKD